MVADTQYMKINSTVIIMNGTRAVRYTVDTCMAIDEKEKVVAPERNIQKEQG